MSQNRKKNDNVVVSIVVPMYNEESSIDTLFLRLFQCLDVHHLHYEIICVDDGSTDKTLEKLISYHERNPSVKIISLSRNFGKEKALTAGLRNTKGDVIIPFDADLQDPPEQIIAMIDKWREGYDVVFATRKFRRNDDILKRTTASLFYKIFNIISDFPIPENTGDFRLIDRRVLEAFKKLPERNRFMKGLLSWPGFKSAVIFYDRKQRVSGNAKISYHKLFKLSLDGLFSFSSIPLRFCSFVGLLMSSIAFIFAFYIFFKASIYGIEVPGYASIIVFMLFLGGINLIFMGILGEYVSRIYSEVKYRPLYIIDKTWGINESEYTF